MTREQVEAARDQIGRVNELAAELPEGMVRSLLESTMREAEARARREDPAGGHLRRFRGKTVRRAVAESSIMRSLDHPFIVQLHSTFEVMDRLFMVMTFVPGGTLEMQARRRGGVLSLEQTRFCVAEIVLALAYLRSQGISHRDLKPSNVLIDEEGHVRLIDFGLATTRDDDDGGAVFCGTCEYVAPEMLLSPRWDTEPLDWWALGVLTYELLAGRVPFAGRNTQEVFTSVMMDRLTFPANFPEDARDFVTQLLRSDPKKRLQPPKIFGHPFFDGVDWRAATNRSEISPLLLGGPTAMIPTSRTLLLPG